ncbi:hypothetical protein C8Q74DRAFT_1213006 [Fomes fomentarius]|nr:hypothetical protein C8Q74DRAFT_1213006 [Fomes fomentarius]
MRLVPFVLLIALPVLSKHGKGESDDDDDDGDDEVKVSPLPPSSSTPSVSTSFTPTSSDPAASPTGGTTSTPFQFLQTDNGTTCEPTTFRWQASPALADMSITLTVTSDDDDRAAANQAGPAVSVSDAPPLVSRTLLTNVSASVQSFTWSAVDVPPGRYVATANANANANVRAALNAPGTVVVSATSPPFFVLAGPDSSCMNTSTAATPTPAPTPISAPATATSGSASHSGSGSGSGSGNEAQGESNAEGASNTTSTTQMGAEPANEPRKLSPAVLGGAVAGVAVGVVILVVVFAFPHFWKARLERRIRSRRPGGPYYLF